MQRFYCNCGNPVFFDNTHCLSCGCLLGFLPETGLLKSLKPADDVHWKVAGTSARKTYRLCRNASHSTPCNWLIPAEDPEPLCLSCRLTSQIPNLGEPRDVENWAKAEAAKRRMIWGLKRLKLPLRSKKQAPDNGLEFALLAPVAGGELGNNVETEEHVLTGHQNGLITINLAESDELHRTLQRLRMRERYRTLLGHFRHEVGHYYHWLLIPPGSEWEAPFEALLGDPSQDYGEALERHYASGPPADWQCSYVSAYASSHPMEDWAECFAHYLHIDDALETAVAFNIIDPLPNPGALGAYEKYVKAFMELSVAHNALSHSLGLLDAYPFVLSENVQAKLRLIHEIVCTSAEA